MPPFDFDTLWDYQHPDQTEATFRRLLAQVEHTCDRSYSLQLLTQIARTQGLQTPLDLLFAAQLLRRLRMQIVLQACQLLSSGHPLEHHLRTAEDLLPSDSQEQANLVPRCRCSVRP